MEFEEIQDLWDRQNDEELFTIDETALHNAIKRKSKSVTRWLVLLEWMMIVVNIVVAVVLLVDAFREGGPDYQYVVVAMYVAYSLYAFVRHLNRRQEEVRFEETVLGELNRAIWRVDYLIRFGRYLPLWYLLPLALAGSVSLYLSSTSWWKAALLLLLVPASYVGARWEINKWHLPKKRALESLREQLLASDRLD